MRRLRDFLRREDGPTAVEYAVMLAMVVMLCAAGINVFGQQTKSSFEASQSRLAEKLNSQP